MLKIYQLAKDMLNALVELQNQTPPLIHRDIKPQNIIWDNKKRFVLIDFNVASVYEESQEYVGTNPYIAPDLILGNVKVDWNTSADTFALGITLYELACKNYPWPNKMPRISKAPVHPQEQNPKLSDAFAAFLHKAIQPVMENRFSSAAEMLKALEQIPETNLLKAEKEKGEFFKVDKEGNQEDFVDYINSLFSQSKNGNAGTRAQSTTSAFDHLTYVETRLDTTLLPSILDGAFKLVIITGNAGDGKTAFIKKIEEKAEGSQKLSNRNGASFKIKGISYLSNYDGSQDEDDKANDLVLEDFFQPFENSEQFHEAKEGRIIAINEGRLADFLSKSGKHKILEKVIEDFFHEEGNTVLPEGLLIINLNLRSVVASDAKSNQASILRKQIEKITAPELWDKCASCAVAKKCFIRFNVQSFNDSSAGNEIIHRLEWLLRTISYKRELHITIRDLRSFIAWLITRDYRCNEVEEVINQLQNEPHTYWKLLYFNMSAPGNDNASNDRLVKMIRETDIASTAVPAVDRDLYFAQHNPVKFIAFEQRDIDIIEEFNANKEIRPAHEQNDDTIELDRMMHRSYRRHHYFEGKEMYKSRLPYQSIYTFFELINSENEEEIIKAKYGISKAIALNEGCDNESVFDKYILLSSSQVKDSMAKSFRRFPIEDFELKINQPKHLVQYLEYEADSLIFRHTGSNSKHVKLIISLDLYEMLQFIANGYSPSLNDLRGKYIELQIFKNLLENLEYSEVLVTKDNNDFYRISKNPEGKLKLESITI